MKVTKVDRGGIKKKSGTMYGEDSSGRKVSLLNNDGESSSNINNKKPTPPRLLSYSHKSRSSISSSMSREDFHSLSSSSNSVSPGISPSTPQQLFHLDTLTSLETRSTPSPMTPGYPFEALEHAAAVHHQQNNNNNSKQNPTPYYTYHRPLSNHGGYPAMSPQDPVPHPYYSLNSHHRMSGDMEMVDHHTAAYPHSLRSQLQPLHTRSLGPSSIYSSNSPVDHQSSITSLPSPPTSLSIPSHSSAQGPNSNGMVAPQAQSQQQQQQQQPQLHPSVSSPVSAAATSASTPTGSKPPKKKYPCPHAARYACRDTFTTSGHAARHGKKHTGEKNIHCPTCNKAFTRKDNMKQHERTHKPSRMENPAVNNNSAPSPTTPGLVQPTRFSTSSSSSSLNNRNSVNRPVRSSALPRSRSTSQPLPDRPEQHDFSSPPSINSRLSPPSIDLYTSQPPQQQHLVQGYSPRRPTSSRSDEADEDELDGEGESPGLDALATAASEMEDA